MNTDLLQWIIPIAGVAAVLFAVYLARDVLSRDQGPQAMQDVAGTIFEGAIAFNDVVARTSSDWQSLLSCTGHPPDDAGGN